MAPDLPPGYPREDDGSTRPNRFGWDDEQGWPQFHRPVQCSSCKHRTPGDGWPSCRAFERIPLEVLADTVDHRHSIPGDHGVQWAPRD